MHYLLQQLRAIAGWFVFWVLWLVPRTRPIAWLMAIARDREINSQWGVKRTGLHSYGIALYCVARRDREIDAQWEAQWGVTRTELVSYGIAAYCVACGGNGSLFGRGGLARGQPVKSCRYCQGKGIVPLIPCGFCSGKGVVGRRFGRRARIADVCPVCRGEDSVPN